MIKVYVEIVKDGCSVSRRKIDAIAYETDKAVVVEIDEQRVVVKK